MLCSAGCQELKVFKGGFRHLESKWPAMEDKPWEGLSLEKTCSPEELRTGGLFTLTVALWCSPGVSLPPPSSSTEHIAGCCRKRILACGNCCLWGGDTMGNRSPRTQHPSHLAATAPRLLQRERSPASQSKLPFDRTNQQVPRVLGMRSDFLEALQEVSQS